MEGLIRSTRWKNLKQKIGYRVIGCCGVTWSTNRFLPNLTITEEEEDDGDNHQISHVEDNGHVLVGPNSRGTINLRMALQAERNQREPTTNMGPTTEKLKTLLRLIEETDRVDLKSNDDGKILGGDWVCCVCMERNKGAAFIPCGHTFCRVCSRELWVNRRSCPICNRSIQQILDIF